MNNDTKAFLVNLIDGIPLPISIHGKDQKIILANQALKDFLQYPESELVGKTCLKVLHNDKLPEHCPFIQDENRSFGESNVSICDNHASVSKVVLDNESYYVHIIRQAQREDGLAKQVINAVEVERKVLASEIHDDLLQTGFSAMAHCNSALQRAGSAEAKERLKLAIRSLDKMLSTGRQIVKELRPPLLETVGLVPAIVEHAKSLFEQHPIIFESSINFDSRKLTPELETTIFRVTQEALLNVLKHSGCSKVKFSIMCSDQIVEVYIEDNGQGLPDNFTENNPEHLGLKLMKQRVEMHNGLFCISSTRGKGAKISAIFPLKSGSVIPNQESYCVAR